MSRRFRQTLLLAFAVLAPFTLVPSCGGGGPTVSVADRKQADEFFNTLCVTCHGQSGTGDGPGAAALDPKPRNYTDKAWQASVTDEALRTIIVRGGAAVGKSAMMPASPQLKDKPGVVQGLVEKVRSFAK